MTNEEKQEIISAVLEALATNSKTISNLTPVTELMDSDLFEVAGGKRVTFANIVASLLSSSGYAAATAAEQADMWQVLMQNFVATQENESVGGVQPQLAHWAQSRVVLLKSMGAPFDDVEASTLSVGDLIYSSQGKWIFEKLQNNLGNGIHPSDGVLYVNLATFKAYRWDGTSFQDAIKGGSGASSVTAFAQYSVVESTSELPSVGDPTTGYIVGTHIYAYVGEDGDTADGKYQDLGALEAAGVSVTTAEDGTFTIHAGGNDYTVNLNHTHPNMCKLVVCEESGLPSTLDNSTIYAITDSGETEIEKLIIRGMEFAGGGIPDTGEPMISSPSNGSTINLGTNEGSGVSKTITVKGKNLTGDLTVAVGTGLTISYGQALDASRVTIPMAQALLGAQVTIAYSGSGALDDGSLVISHGGSVLSSVVVVVVPTPEEITAVKFTGSQWLKTDYFPNPNTEFELDCQFVANSHTEEAGLTPNGPCPYFISCEHEGDNRFNFQVGSKEAGSNTAYRIACYNNTVSTRGEIMAFNASANHSGMTVRSTLAYSKQASSMSMTFNNATSTDTVPLKANTMQSELAIGHSYYFDAQFNSFDLIIYRFKIIENGVIVRDYKPVILDGVPGLYDYVNNNFISSETNVELVPIS